MSLPQRRRAQQDLSANGVRSAPWAQRVQPGLMELTASPVYQVNRDLKGQQEFPD